MDEENLIPNTTYSAKDVGEAFKVILERLNERKNEKIEISHICSTCKHRCTETYLTPDWMVEKVWHNWCGLNKKYMETEYGHGNNKHFLEPCEHWEISDYYKDKDGSDEQKTEKEVYQEEHD